MGKEQGRARQKGPERAGRDPNTWRGQRDGLLSEEIEMGEPEMEKKNKDGETEIETKRQRQEDRDEERQIWERQRQR